jgi:predicted metalloprotease
MAIGGGIGSLLLVLLVMFLGGDPSALLDVGTPDHQVGVRPTSRAQDELKQFVAVVLADTEDVWHEQFRELGREYREPKIVFYSGQVQSACGFASAATGPFYCPPDERVYIDLEFFEELKGRFGAPGDFAVAYVVAHEIGHHVQRLLGYTDRVHGRRGRVDQREYNQLSVRLELQADFLAGVWAHHAQRTKNILESGDIEEAMRAASAVGDDRLQRRARGYVAPDTFTHGTSQQRARWFRRGLQTGELSRRDDLFRLPYEEL